MTTPVTVRLPDELAQFVQDRAEMLHQNKTAVVVAALEAERRRLQIDQERAVYLEHGGDPYPDLAPASGDDVSVVWKDLDW